MVEIIISSLSCKALLLFAQLYCINFVAKHYENLPMQYTEIFLEEKIENFLGKKIFLLKPVLFGYMLEPPRRGGSNEYPQCMCWIKNKKKIGIPLHTIVLLYKSGVQEGIHLTDIFSWWIIVGNIVKLCRILDIVALC